MNLYPSGTLLLTIHSFECNDIYFLYCFPSLYWLSLFAWDAESTQFRAISANRGMANVIRYLLGSEMKSEYYICFGESLCPPFDSYNADALQIDVNL